MIFKNIANIQGLAFGTGLLLMVTSCEKVIQLDLNSVEKKYVIEANLAKIKPPTGASKDTAWVKVSQTKDFGTGNAFVGVSGAAVTISDNGGPAVALAESSTGVFASAGVNFVFTQTAHKIRKTEQDQCRLSVL